MLQSGGWLAIAVTGGVDFRGTHLPFVNIVRVPRLFLLVRGRHLEFCGVVEKIE